MYWLIEWWLRNFLTALGASILIYGLLHWLLVGGIERRVAWWIRWRVELLNIFLTAIIVGLVVRPDSSNHPDKAIHLFLVTFVVSLALCVIARRGRLKVLDSDRENEPNR